MENRPNIVLITIDSLRADHLGFMGYEKNISPNIDTLAREGTVFTNAYSVGPITLYSFPSILTSTYPLDYNGPYKIEKPRKMISEALKDYGFITAAFHSSPFLSDYFGYNKGWDFFKDIKPKVNILSRRQRKEIVFIKEIFKKLCIRFFPGFFIFLCYLKYRIGWKKNNKTKGSSVTSEVKNFIYCQENTRAFLLWVHYMDLHSPYFSRENFKKEPFSFSEYKAGFSLPLLGHYQAKKLKKIAKKNIDVTKDLYNDGIKYVDEQIKDLIGFLKSKDLYENSVIIIVGDHGDEFFEHGSGSHLSNLYDEVLHVPLLIRIPGKEPDKIESPVSLIDLSPTICGILNIEKDNSFKGYNLFKRPDVPIFHQIGSWKADFDFLLNKDSVNNFELENSNQHKIACRFKDWKYILDYGSEQEELYNLLTDPKEKNNVVEQEKEIVSKMNDNIQEFLRSNPPFLSVK